MHCSPCFLFDAHVFKPPLPPGPAPSCSLPPGTMPCWKWIISFEEHVGCLALSVSVSLSLTLSLSLSLSLSVSLYLSLCLGCLWLCVSILLFIFSPTLLHTRKKRLAIHPYNLSPHHLIVVHIFPTLPEGHVLFRYAYGPKSRQQTVLRHKINEIAFHDSPKSTVDV